MAIAVAFPGEQAKADDPLQLAKQDAFGLGALKMAG